MNRHGVVSDSLIDALAPGATSVQVERLQGGVSADTFLLTLVSKDGTQERLVVRHLPRADTPRTLSSQEEYALLSSLHLSGFLVPRPRMIWESDTIVMEWVEGTTALPPRGPELMARALARIHAHQNHHLTKLLPPRENPLPLLLEAANSPGTEELKPVLSSFVAQGQCLLHGDFWPGNLLWRNNALVAVLDWEDAAIGDPLSDVACARVELEVVTGEDSSRRFTTEYVRQTGCDTARLPYWDLYVATAALSSMDSWGLPKAQLQQRRKATEAFRDRALKASISRSAR